VRASSVGHATIKDYITTLEATIDAAALSPGKYQLGIRRSGGEWQCSRRDWSSLSTVTELPSAQHFSTFPSQTRPLHSTSGSNRESMSAASRWPTPAR
jgi:hypothetical protein